MHGEGFQAMRSGLWGWFNGVWGFFVVGRRGYVRKRMHFSVRFVRFVRCPCLLSALPLGKKPLIRP
jgi:hypothetical protein